MNFPLNLTEVIEQQVHDQVQFNHVMNGLVSELQKANELLRSGIRRSRNMKNSGPYRLDSTERRGQVINILIALKESKAETAALNQ